MKSDKGFQTSVKRTESDYSTKRAVKLEPIKKSGKEKHALYGDLEEDDESLLDYKKRDSVLDYFDDGEQDD